MAEPQRRPRPGERREQILEVALGLFAERGAGNVTTRQIAEAVGISQPSLYAHFPSADAIADELCVRAFAALETRFAETLRNLADPTQQIDMLGRAYIEFGLEHPDMYRLAFMPTRVEPCPPDLAMPPGAFDLATTDPGLAAGLRAFSALRDPIRALCGGDDLRIATIAQVIWASVHGITALLISKPYFPWVEREALIEAVLDMGHAYIASMRWSADRAPDTPTQPSP